MKKVTMVVPEYNQSSNGTYKELTCEWAYILDTKKITVTKVKVKNSITNK